MTRRDIRSPPCGAVTATASLFIFDARQDEIHGHSLTQDRGLFARPRAPRFIAIAQGSARAAGSLSYWLNLNENGFVGRKWTCRDRFRLTQDSKPWPPQ
jgi:hypothetical protein